MTNDDYQRALDARDPRGVEMVEQLVTLARQALDVACDGKGVTFEAACRERFAQFAQSQCFALDEAHDAGRTAAYAHVEMQRVPVANDVEVDEPALGAAPPEPAPHFELYALGICSASVCSNLPIERVIERMNAESPTGIASPWALSTDATFSDGTTPNGCACQANHAPGARHWLLSW